MVHQISNVIPLNEQIKDVLKKSGLSEKEIEIFILLNRKRMQKGTEIAKQLKMNRGQVYRILKSLERKSFVEATLERPKRFIARQLLQRSTAQTCQSEGFHPRAWRWLAGIEKPLGLWEVGHRGGRRGVGVQSKVGGRGFHG